MSMRISRALIALAVANLMLAGCASDRWSRAKLGPVSAEVMRRELALQAKDTQVSQVPVLPEPRHLRPCCAFGSDIRVSVKGVRILGVEIPNTVGPEDLGDHEYDGGTPMVGGFDFDSLKTGEKNGLVYTCRAGFVDTAHLRLWADYTLYLTAWIAAHLETGGELQIKPEGGERKIVLHPLDPPELLRQYTRRQLVVPVAQQLAWDLSVWHEIVTWYGWSHVGMFPELASAFSPEDFYSNLLGIKLSGALVYERQTVSESNFNNAMTILIDDALEMLGGQSKEIGRSASRYADQVWWDSKAKLPSKSLIQRRFFEVNGNRITPWRVVDIDGGAPADVEAACGDAPVHTLWLDETFGGLRTRDRANIEITVSKKVLKAGFVLPEGRQVVTPADFPELIERIRLENEKEFGPGSDSPKRRPVVSAGG